MFKMIEEVFTDLKRSIRASCSTTTRAKALGIHNLPWGKKARARRRLLFRALDIVFQGINMDYVNNHDAHAFSFMAPTLRRVA
jgi:hypothetical protein